MLRLPITEPIVVGAVILCALAVRLWMAWPAISGEWGFRIGDDDDYHQLALALLQNGQLAVGGHPSAYRMPAFPLLLAGAYALFGSAPGVGYLAQVVLSSLNVGLTYLFGRQLGGRAVGIVAGLLALIDLEQITYATLLMTETLCTLLLTVTLLALLAQRRSDRPWLAALAGLALGLAALTRVNMLGVVPIACLWLFRYGRGSVRQRIARAGLVALLCVGLWGAWVARNALVFGAFIPMTTQGGSGYYGVFNDEAFQTQPLDRYGVWRDLPLPGAVAQMSELEMDRWQRAAAIAWIRSHPGESAKLALVQVYHFWRSDNSPLYPPLLALAVVGLVMLLRERSPDAALLVLLGGMLTTLALVALAVPRFHIPLLPGITALAALAAVRTTGSILTRYNAWRSQ